MAVLWVSKEGGGGRERGRRSRRWEVEREGRRRWE